MPDRFSAPAPRTDHPGSLHSGDQGHGSSVLCCGCGIMFEADADGFGHHMMTWECPWRDGDPTWHWETPAVVVRVDHAGAVLERVVDLFTPRFVSLDEWELKREGKPPRWVTSTLLDRHTATFAHLIGQKVAIDGVRVTCLGVERFMHCAPWRAGEKIGIAHTERLRR